MTVFFSQLINGLSLGSIYALIALGYSMVYGIILLLNFAHGDIIMVGAYMSWFVMNQLGLGPVTAVCATIIVCTLLAALYDLICALPEGLYDALHADAVQAFGLRVLPFAGAGLGWICPLALGFVIGLAVHLMQKFRTK